MKKEWNHICIKRYNVCKNLGNYLQTGKNIPVIYMLAKIATIGPLSTDFAVLSTQNYVDNNHVFILNGKNPFKVIK